MAGLDDVDADGSLGAGMHYEEPASWRRDPDFLTQAGMMPPYVPHQEPPIISDQAARNFQVVGLILALALILRALRALRN